MDIKSKILETVKKDKLSIREVIENVIESDKISMISVSFEIRDLLLNGKLILNSERKLELPQS